LQLDVRKTASALALAITLAGCAGDATRVTNPSPLDGTAWRLSRLERADHTVVTITDPDRYTLSFAGSRLSIRSDCNRCSGTYQLTSAVFTVGPLACTKAFCGEASLDSEYSTMVSDARSLQLDDDALVVRPPRGTLRYTR
jgi:heat shock protein HslJ